MTIDAPSINNQSAAAVAIGGTAMSGSRGKVIGTFPGVLMFKIIIIAVLLQSMRGKKK